MVLRRLMICWLVALSACVLRAQTAVTAEVAALLSQFATRYARELAELKSPMLVEQRLADDKVLFMQGSASDLQHLPATCDLDITAGNGYYEMTWSREGVPFLRIALPAQNTLITGRSQRELVEQLPAELRSCPRGFPATAAPQVLEPIENGVWATPDESYYLASLNDALYYVREADGKTTPLFADTHRDYSAANLLHGIIDRDCRLNIELSLFDFSSLHVEVTLAQWVNYCRAHGLHVYCGLEEERQDGLKMLVVAENRELKYNHTLSVVVPAAFVADATVALHAHMNAYIPTHNVKDLFKQYTEKKQKRFKL